MKSFKGRLRRTFKVIYPWFNATFELWLLVSNVAYLFDRTPYYRPWLAWIGVDLRRLGMEDFVGHWAPRCELYSYPYIIYPATGQSCCPHYWDQYAERPSCSNTKAYTFLAATPFWFPSPSSTHRHILPQIFRMVVLTRIASTLPHKITARPSRSTSKNAPTSSKWHSYRQHKIWPVSTVPWPYQQCYGVTIWIRFLLSLRLWSCWTTWEMPRHPTACEGLAIEEDHGMIACDEPQMAYLLFSHSQYTFWSQSSVCIFLPTYLFAGRLICSSYSQKSANQ